MTLLSDQLKIQTKTHHQLLERQLIPLIKTIRDRRDYAELIMLFYTYFGGLELLVDATLHVDCLPDYLKRRKTAVLANDLYSMNVSVQPFANNDQLPAIANHLQAIGAMYVMEGSTLGGLHISKMIQEKLNTGNEKGFLFFNGYKTETQLMWNEFKKSIDKMLLNSHENNVVIDAANETFIRFSDWVRPQ